MNKALETNACDIIGLGRPLCSEPDLVNNLLSGHKSSAILYENILELGPWILGLNSPFKMIKSNNRVAQVYWCYRQILEIADKKDVDPKISLISALIKHFRDDAKLSKKYKKYWQDLN